MLWMVQNQRHLNGDARQQQNTKEICQMFVSALIFENGGQNIVVENQLKQHK
jgi:hypothetical protein